MASSRPIAAGETYTPTDINNLRADVLDPTGGHKHNGVDGARVPFANLDVTGAAGSTPPPGGDKSYNDIATHVAANQGVHGLNALANVLGALTPNLLIQTGRIPCVLSAGNPGSDSATGEVLFANAGVVFSSAPFVFGQQSSTTGLSSVGIYNVTTNGFTWVGFVGSYGNMAHIDWLAIGPKAP